MSCPAGDSLHITVEFRARALVLVVTGEVSSTTAPHLRDALGNVLIQASLQRTVAGHPVTVVVDLTRVEVTDSDGLLGALVGAANEAQHRQEPLLIVVDHHQPVLEPMQVAGLDAFLRLTFSVPDALRLAD